ncbi:MAG: RDD family protein [Dokdonella sp.]
MSRLAPAPLWLRLGAAIYDLLPLLALWMIVAALALLGLKTATGELDLVHAPWAYWWSLRLGVLVVTSGYFVISWMRGGQTIGMRAWRLKIVDRDEAALSLRSAAIRFIVAIISVAAFGLGFIWCLVDRERRAWHDIAAATRLVRLPKQ